MSSRLLHPARAAMLAALSCAALAFVSTQAIAAVSGGTHIQLHSTALGKVLSNRSGFTLYVFTRDRRNSDRCVGVHGCTGIWPVLKTSAAPVAGRGVRGSLLGTIRLAHGVRQVTYAGHPLYRYVGDGAPGESDYVGTPEFGGTWYAINSAGRFVK